jgi:hypothetical protein
MATFARASRSVLATAPARINRGWRRRTSRRSRSAPECAARVRSCLAGCEPKDSLRRDSLWIKVRSHPDRKGAQHDTGRSGNTTRAGRRVTRSPRVMPLRPARRLLDGAASTHRKPAGNVGARKTGIARGSGGFVFKSGIVVGLSGRRGRRRRPRRSSVIARRPVTSSRSCACLSWESRWALRMAGSVMAASPVDAG